MIILDRWRADVNEPLQILHELKHIFFKYFWHTMFSYDCVKADVPYISASHCGKEGSELKKTLAFFPRSMPAT